MNSKAEALASAKTRIIALQSQMSSRILQMAKEVEKLLEAITEQEAREFLRATCNVPPRNCPPTSASAAVCAAAKSFSRSTGCHSRS